MLNVTKLAIWPQLQALGFVPVRFHAHGKVAAIGAALQQNHISTTGKPFKSDIICIEPHYNTGNCAYHITGDVKTPFQEQLFRYEGGRKVAFYDTCKRINEFYTAREILKTVELMLK